MSVRMRVLDSVSRSSLARIWPMKPPAPVMRIRILRLLEL